MYKQNSKLVIRFKMERDVPAIYATLIPFLGSLDTSEIRFVRGLQYREIILKGRWFCQNEEHLYENSRIHPSSLLGIYMMIFIIKLKQIKTYPQTNSF